MSPRVLVTGAAGFVGANLCRWLLRHGHPVHAVVRPGTDPWRLAEIRRDITIHRADLRDADAVRATVRTARADWLMHLGAHGAYSWQTDTDTIIATNTVATTWLIDLAGAGAFASFVQAGSTAEYGARDRPPRESDPAEPYGPYAVSKASATRHARAVSLDHGAHLVTLRLATAYGYWEDPGRLMPTLAMYGRRRRLPPLTDPATVRDFVFVDDVCDAFTRAAAATHLERGSILNIGSGMPTSLAELVALARAEFGIDVRPHWSTMPPRMWDPKLCVADCTLGRHALGWQPRRDLAEGLRALSDWLARDPVTSARYERAIGLPS